MSSNLGKYAAVFALLATFVCTSCQKKESEQKGTLPPATPATVTAAVAPLPAPFGRYTDDLDQIFKRQNLRALVILDPMGFFYNNGHPMGTMYEALRELETYINQKQKTKTFKIKVTFIPVRADRAEAALMQGVGDVIAYPVIVTPDRQERFAFTVPLASDVSQIVVAGPSLGSVARMEDLGGKQVYVNRLSANYQTLQQLNAKWAKEGKQQIKLEAADENLSEEDILQMVNGGLVQASVSNPMRASLWAQILPNLTARKDLVVASGEQLAWALRKNNPKLKELLDEFIPPHAVGTSFGNTLLRRYLQNTKWVRNSTSGEEMKKFAQLSETFKKYAGQYDFDYLMIMAQAYQESMLDQNARNGSSVGIMQVNPKLAAASPINVPTVGTAETNIEAGVKMLRHIEEEYFDDPKISQMDKTMMVFASYNAGPTRVARLRKEAAEQGLDPNKWFDNVELMVAKDVGEVTVTYVRNIYKYYVAYKLAMSDAGTGQHAEPSRGN